MSPDLIMYFLHPQTSLTQLQKGHQGDHLDDERTFLINIHNYILYFLYPQTSMTQLQKNFCINIHDSPLVPQTSSCISCIPRPHPVFLVSPDIPDPAAEGHQGLRGDERGAGDGVPLVPQQARAWAVGGGCLPVPQVPGQLGDRPRLPLLLHQRLDRPRPAQVLLALRILLPSR